MFSIITVLLRQTNGIKAISQVPPFWSVLSSKIYLILNDTSTGLSPVLASFTIF